MHRVVAAFAKPWAAIWPAAAPTLDLVETSRYFRVSPDVPHVHFIDPVAYGAWWPFLLMSLVGYALVPRAIVTLQAERRRGRECAGAIAETPGLDRLIERLLAPPVETRAPENEAEIGPCPGSSRVVAPSGAPPGRDRSRWRGRSDRGRGLGRDRGAEAFVCATRGAAQSRRGRGADRGDRRVGRTRCRAGVRAAGPRVLDFLTDLRPRGAGRAIAVFLLDGSSADHDAWRRKLSRWGSRLVCAPLRASGWGGDEHAVPRRRRPPEQGQVEPGRDSRRGRQRRDRADAGHDASDTRVSHDRRRAPALHADRHAGLPTRPACARPARGARRGPAGDRGGSSPSRRRVRRGARPRGKLPGRVRAAPSARRGRRDPLRGGRGRALRPRVRGGDGGPPLDRTAEPRGREPDRTTRTSCRSGRRRSVSSSGSCA